MTTTNKFLQRIKEHRESKKEEKFSGSLAQYLEILEDDAGAAALAHRRLYDQIMSHGLQTLDESDHRCNKIFDGEVVKV
jgi:serine protein kinase